MSENKFIAKLKGEPTPKSVVEIQNDRLVAPFKSSPMGHIADRDSSVVVAKGAQNWAVNQGQLVPVADDYIGTESDLTTTSRVSGAGLWLNATYTFPATGDETNPVSAIIAPSAKWVLTLCGDSLITQNGSVITLTMLVKIGATHLTTKQFKVRECASQFSQRLAIDFSESEQSVIKAHGGSPLTVQVLCDDEGASATIYSGMTHLTLLQRKIDADLVATDNVLLPEFIENLLEGYIIPADYFSRYDYIEQVEDGGKAMPEFTRNGDNMTFTGWAKPAEEVYTKTEIDDKFTVANAQIDANATAIQKTRDDMNEEDGRLQTQITAQAAEIATKQDKLIAGDNITIVDNVISATGGGGGGGGIANVIHDATLTGSGTNASPLGLAEAIKDEIADKAPKETVEALTQIVNGIIGDYVKKSGDTMTGALNVPEFTVSTAEGTLSISVVAGVPVIATNNGLDVASRVKFDYAPTTDDSTTYAEALEVSLLRKAQVATAIADAVSNIDALPDQTGNAGKVLMTDGAAASWQKAPAGGTKVIIKRYE